MVRSVYVETSVISYMAARPSGDLVTAAHQHLTAEWWSRRRGDFSVYVSELVVREISAGDPIAARRRLALTKGIPLLAVSEEASRLAEHIVAAGAVPAAFAADAVHIAIAAANGMDFLITWNCRHIANAEMRAQIDSACREMDYRAPVLCTPEQLMGE